MQALLNPDNTLTDTIWILTPDRIKTYYYRNCYRMVCAVSYEVSSNIRLYASAWAISWMPCIPTVLLIEKYITNYWLSCLLKSCGCIYACIIGTNIAVYMQHIGIIAPYQIYVDESVPGDDY